VAGHSHWKSIKHQKGAADAKRSKAFSKFSKAIMIAARDGTDPKFNLKLSYAIDKARAGNMPKDAIEKAIKKGSGEGDTKFEELTYEGYGAGGIAFVVETLSDNRNRTAPELRRLFDVKGGKLGAPGSALRFFERKGLLSVAKDKASEEQIFELATEAGAEDIQTSEDAYHITTGAQDFLNVKNALLGKELELAQAEIAFVPTMTTPTPDPKDAQRVEGLIESLEDHDDVQNVYTNWAGPSGA
jgi:YebC/PmpR family DNA-binding regulatory protein